MNPKHSTGANLNNGPQFRHDLLFDATHQGAQEMQSLIANLDDPKQVVQVGLLNDNRQYHITVLAAAVLVGESSNQEVPVHQHPNATYILASTNVGGKKCVTRSKRMDQNAAAYQMLANLLTEMPGDNRYAVNPSNEFVTDVIDTAGNIHTVKDTKGNDTAGWPFQDRQGQTMMFLLSGRDVYVIGWQNLTRAGYHEKWAKIGSDISQTFNGLASRELVHGSGKFITTTTNGEPRLLTISGNGTTAKVNAIEVPGVTKGTNRHFAGLLADGTKAAYVKNSKEPKVIDVAFTITPETLRHEVRTSVQHGATTGS